MNVYYFVNQKMVLILTIAFLVQGVADDCSDQNYLFTPEFDCETYKYYVNESRDLENKLFEYWIIIASVYIILMQLGFILLETG